MSSAVGYIPYSAPLSSMTPPGMSLGSAAAAGGIAVLVCYASYLAIKKLHQDYRYSLATFNARAEGTAAARAEATAEARAVAAAAAAIAGHTEVRAAQQATRTFVARQLKRMVARVDDLPTTDPDLRGRLLALQAMVEAGQGEADEVLTAYRAAAESLAAVAVKAGTADAARQVLVEEVQALREEVMASELAEERHAALRDELLQHLAALETLAAGQPKAATQGLTNLRRRVHRHLRELREGAAAKVKLAGEMRTLASETLARLQAVAGLEHLPERRAEAMALLARLNALLVAEPVEIEALRGLAREAEALFNACDHTLEQQVVAEYVGQQVSEVLLALGYRVAQVPGEGESPNRTVMAAVDARFGLQVQVDGEGRLRSQMVALTEDAAAQGQEGEEEVCALVERVVAALRARDIEVAERFRSHLAEGERLDVVAMPAHAPVAAQAEAARPRAMRVEQP